MQGMFSQLCFRFKSPELVRMSLRLQEQSVEKLFREDLVLEESVNGFGQDSHKTYALLSSLVVQGT